MNAIADLPELRALDSRSNLIRIPGEQDVPVTERVRRLIDTAAFQRLSGIRQLGLVSLVYPGSTHTRFEHSLGVYRNSLLYLRRLATDPRFVEVVSPTDAETLIVASLFHDLGHYPFCHPIEDLQLPEALPHERLAQQAIEHSEISQLLDEQWETCPGDVINLVSGLAHGQSHRILQSILSGPIDIDKMDYLYRDSLHAGVPYGMHYDRQRLIGSLCLNENADAIAITEKGRTAAELMVFARYVMFSEVYWHHAVRSATAMLQRIVYTIQSNLDLPRFLQSSDECAINEIRGLVPGTCAQALAECLFGTTRRLYKRTAQYSFLENEDLFQRLAQRPYGWLQKCAAELAAQISNRIGDHVQGHEILIDAPPVCLEVQFHVNVFYPKQREYRWLGEVSPVVKSLAEHQFDNFVKRVRVFAHPRLLEKIGAIRDIDDLLWESVRVAGPP